MNWMEKASFKKIQKLLEISEREQYHKIFLNVRNLCELSLSPYPYILPVILRPLPTEIVESEHVIADLLNLAPGSLSPAKNLEIEAVGRDLVISTHPGQPSLVREDSGPIPQISRKDNRDSRLERFPHTKRVPVLPPKHLRREGGCLNG